MRTNDGVKKAAKLFITVSFVLFMSLFCLGKYLLSIAVLAVGIAGFIIFAAVEMRLVRREERHFIRNIMPEYGKLCQENYLAAARFLESELEYSRNDPKFSCNKNFLAILLAAHYGNDSAKYAQYIELVSPEELKRDGEHEWLTAYYSVKMDAALMNEERSLAKEYYERLCGDIDMSKFANNFNVIKMKSEYLLLCGDFEGALREAERIRGDDTASCLCSFQCRVNALINLGRLDEAEELVGKMKRSDNVLVQQLGLDKFDKFYAAIKRKRDGMELRKESDQ